MMYLVALHLVETGEEFNLYCENEEEMHTVLKYVEKLEELELVQVASMPLTVKAKDYVEQIKTEINRDKTFLD